MALMGHCLGRWFCDRFEGGDGSQVQSPGMRRRAIWSVPPGGVVSLSFMHFGGSTISWVRCFRDFLGEVERS
jgi:hypothetical protein